MRFNLNNKKVLILKLQGMGDTVLLLPVIHELIKKYPDIQLDIAIGNNSSAELLKLSNLKIKHMFILRSGIYNYIKFILKFIFQRYYLIFLPYKSGKKENLISFLTLCKRRVGYAYKKAWKEYYWKLFDFLINYQLIPDVNKHDIVLNLELVGYIRKKINKLKLLFSKIIINKEAQNTVNDFLKINHVNDYILFHLSAGDVNRLWSLQNYIKLIGKILKKYKNYKIILIGQSIERARNMKVINSFKNNNVIQFDDKSLSELIYILKKAYIVAGNDSGIMHLASLVNNTIISLVGYTSCKRSSPAGNKVYILRKDLPCSPCYKVFFPIHCIYKEKKCLIDIKVEDVWSIFQKIIEKKKITAEQSILGTHIINI